MSRTYTLEGYRYIVTEEQAQRIKVYNDSWELLHSFGGEGSTEGLFNGPAGTAITEMGTVLIADCDNHRISHYSLDGQFLSHVVNKDDGLEYPVGIRYRHPYLWVCRWNADYVNCFELTEL